MRSAAHGFVGQTWVAEWDAESGDVDVFHVLGVEGKALRLLDLQRGLEDSVDPIALSGKYPWWRRIA